MTPERWQRVKDLFEAAVWRSPPARSEFLTRACPDDEGVRREVQSLLMAHDLDPEFMSTPVGTLLLDEAALLTVGQRFGNYEQPTPIGKGGMGHVFSAIDSRLGRKIALKLLPSSLMHDTERAGRFQQEARAASALNHPNIVTIHEIGEVDSVQFIATEFVDGETLREHISRRRISIDEVVNISSQICSALKAAHEAGIVHRDIKPENIMVRRDGLVKLLDFGLAKLAPERLEVYSPARAKPMVHTKPGVVMGTAGYMSPEQARAAAVDERTDIWSVGVVMYEMVSRRAPFVGETSSHIIDSILKHEPPPLSINSEVPDELQRIVSKCLVKDREQRYQRVRDLLVDLKLLKQRLEVDAAIGGTAGPRKNGDNAAATAIHKPVPTDDLAFGRTGLLLDDFAPGLESSRRRQWVIAGMLVCVMVIAPVAYWGYQLSTKGAAVTQTNAPVRSVAVLPFENQTPDPDADYLAETIPQTLITKLWEFADLRATARGPSKYTGKAVDIQDAAETLGVTAILTGSIAKRGDTIVFSVELIDARDNAQLWREQYTYELTDVLAVEVDICNEIVHRLRDLNFKNFVVDLRR